MPSPRGCGRSVIRSKTPVSSRRRRAARRPATVSVSPSARPISRRATRSLVFSRPPISTARSAGLPSGFHGGEGLELAAGEVERGGERGRARRRPRAAPATGAGRRRPPRSGPRGSARPRARSRPRAARARARSPGRARSRPPRTAPPAPPPAPARTSVVVAQRHPEPADSGGSASPRRESAGAGPSFVGGASVASAPEESAVSAPGPSAAGCTSSVQRPLLAHFRSSSPAATRRPGPRAGSWTITSPARVVEAHDHDVVQPAAPRVDRHDERPALREMVTQDDHLAGERDRHHPPLAREVGEARAADPLQLPLDERRRRSRRADASAPQ